LLLLLIERVEWKALSEQFWLFIALVRLFCGRLGFGLLFSWLLGIGG
jgi:hypothetical protein